jgi:hypothetical protein
VRKVARRLKAAKEVGINPAVVYGATAIKKLEDQLEAAKSINIDVITKEV